jgi:hypothetical protein
MSRPLPFALLSIAAMVLGAAFAQGATADGGGAAGSIVKAPLIKSGRYGSGDVHMDVNVKRRKVSLRFTLYCDDIYVDQYVSNGLKPSKGALDGNRVGAKAFVFGIYSGPAASGPGTQVADWTLNGKFTRPTHFDGRIEYEAATSPEPTTARPQCLDSTPLHLDLQPAG